MQNPKNKYRVAVLGATGLVGQLFVEYLNNHPWFDVAVVTGSPRTIGLPYRESMDWMCEQELSDRTGSLIVQESSAEVIRLEGVDFALSALHSDAARTIEPAFVEAGIRIITNASNFRMADAVPLVVPEVNGRHIEQMLYQPGSAPRIVASPNCSTIGLVASLAPLEQSFGIEHVHVTTMQALSGAGLPGVASMHALGNVIPYIAGEEDKLESEPRKILGVVGDKGELTPSNLRISAQCYRVPVVDGHTCSVSVKLRSKPTIDEVHEAMTSFDGDIAELDLPTKPTRLLRLYNKVTHPQPRVDVDKDSGMTVGVGRLRSCPINDIRYTALVHNTKRGAAGNAVLIAELMAARGHFKKDRKSFENDALSVQPTSAAAARIER